MTSFGWLHITDLHLGMAEQSGFWPTAKNGFFEDLKSVYEKSKPWDLVIFTGDLTQRANADQFKRVDEFLNELWDVLRTFGVQPSLLAVPGNHDLVRPDAKDAHVKLLKNSWETDSEIRSDFWSNPGCDYRKRITSAFENYAEWWARTQFKPPIVSGILPGDFSASIPKDGASLGVIGLNSAFLQLSDGDYKGKLAIDPRQFQEVCGGDGPAWVKRHHACLLLTHQPPDWLSVTSQEYLETDIVGNDNIAVHLFGHMHEARYQTQSKGGAPEVRVFQGTSLFGMEKFGDSNKYDRRYGYTVGRIDLEDEHGSLVFWPRTANQGTGQLNFVVDTKDIFIDGEHTRSKSFPLKKPFLPPISRVAVEYSSTQPPMPLRKRWAVLVGINKYQFFTELNYCQQDVIDLAKSFREVLKFEDVLEIHEAAKIPPDRDSILSNLGDLRDSRKIKPDDVFVFYFSGHGINEGGKDYLLPIGARPRDVKRLGIRIEELVELLKEIDCKNTLMFIDACREAVAGTRGSSAIGQDTNAVVSGANVVTFFSCSPQDRSYEIESLKHGSFTYCILQAIREGVVSTVAELDEYLRVNVPRINSENGKPTQFPYTVVNPPERASLSILLGTRSLTGSKPKYAHIAEKLTQIKIEGGIQEDIFRILVAFLGRISGNANLDVYEQTRLNAIIAFAEGEWPFEYFMPVWEKSVRRPVAGPQIRKPELK